MAPTPSLGRIVHYTLTEQDADAINRLHGGPDHRRDHTHGHVGNSVRAGDVFPLVITRVWGDTETSAVNGQVLLDGNDSLWVTSMSQGTAPRQWFAPPRV